MNSPVSEPKDKQRSKPLYVARVGNVRVPVVRNGKERVAVIWTNVQGERERETYSLKRRYQGPSGGALSGRQMAEHRADEVALSISNSLADVLTLTNADRDSYRLALQMLAPLGIPLHAAIEEYVTAREAIKPHTLMEASNFFKRGAIDRRACPATSQIVSELLARAEDDRRGERYIGPLKKDLERFATAFPDFQAAGEDEIRKYLRELRTKTRRKMKDGTVRPAGEPVSPRRRDNIRDAIVTLSLYAREKGYLPDSTTPAENIARISDGGEVSTYSPADVLKILNYFLEHDSDWLPWAAIQAFGGCRTSEIHRLDWSKFRWDVSTIPVPRSIARKVRTARQVPILPALEAWLAPWRKASGYVIPRKWEHMEAAQTRAIGRLKKAFGWHTWDINALRHSFGSNRLAIVKSYDQVALEMGNSPAKVKEDYNDPKPEAEALAYFAIRPPASLAKIIPFSTAA